MSGLEKTNQKKVPKTDISQPTVRDDILTLQCTTLEKIISETIFRHSMRFIAIATRKYTFFSSKLALCLILNFFWDECTHHGPPKKVF